MICSTCVALEFASDDQLRALVLFQQKQIDRLTGGSYEPPDPALLVAADDGVGEMEPAPDQTFVMESLLGAEDIFRRPPRVAAPRLIERLAQAGLHLTSVEEAR